MRHLTRVFVLIVVSFALPMMAFAQEDLSESYSSGDGSLTFSHPAGWVVEGFGPFALIANDESFSNSDSDVVPPGTVFALISAGPWSDIAPEIDPSGGVSAMEVVQALLDEPDSPQITEGPTELDIGAGAAMMIGMADGNDLMAIIIVVDDENGILLIGGTAAGEMGMFRDTLIAIATSTSFTPPVAGAGAVTADDGPAATAGTGAVAWQQQRPNTFDDTGFGSLGSVAVAPDGTIYVADGINGIRVLDADGNVTSTITSSSVSRIDDMALADDGTLWIIEGFEGMAYNISTDGTLITSFGEKGSGPGQFGEFSPDSFDIGPDGNLYIFDSQQVTEDESAGRIQVIDPQGTFVREFPTDPNGEGKLTSFIQISVAPDGNIYAGDFFSGLTIFDPQGGIVAQGFAEDALQFSTAQAINFGGDGSVYLATNEGLFVVDSAGTLITQFGMRQPFPDEGEAPPLTPGEFSSISGMGVAENGDAIIADTNFQHSQIIRISLEDAAVTPETGTAPTPTQSAEVAPAPTQAAEAAPPKATPTAGGSLADAVQSGDAAPAGGELRQWASSVVATSQYDDPNWSAAQAAGAPDTNECGDFTTAWAAASSTSDEVLTLTYAQAVIPTQINIYQTFNPGSIVRVAVVPADGSLPIDIPNSADPPKNTACPGVFSLNLTGQTLPVNGVVIYLDQSVGGNWNEIDAVELVGTAQ